MRCRKCGSTSNRTKQKCWKNWGLCGVCAVREHPEEYPKNLHGRNLPFSKNFTVGKLCRGCGKRIVKLFVHQTHRKVYMNCYYCRECKLIHSFDNDIEVVQV